MMLETSVYSIKGTNEPEVGSVTGEKYENSEGRCDMICLDKGICTLLSAPSRMGENVNRKA